jgi:NAD(P)H-dependent flavin oxidoreductase YrpB (nitropropane dioxygenase family)
LLRHAASGVDLIVAQGVEAGGHTREVATTVLVRGLVNVEQRSPLRI